MSRRFLDLIRADLTALLVTDGETPAPALNVLLIDIIDSTIQDESLINSTGETLAVPSTVEYSSLTTVYDEEQGDDGDFLNPDFATGQIISGATAGFTYIVEASLSFTDLNSNTLIDFTILQNGTPVGAQADESGEGNNKPVNIRVSAYINSAGVSDVFTLGMRTPAGIIAIDILQATLALIILPTNNP